MLYFNHASSPSWVESVLNKFYMLERETSLELATFGLEGRCSTNWATPAVIKVLIQYYKLIKNEMAFVSSLHLNYLSWYYVVMSALTSLFLGTFLLLYSIFYPIFKRPIFATYVVILLILSVFAFRLFQYLKAQSFAKKNLRQRCLLLFFWVLQAYLVLMIGWYVFIHFKTYKIM